MKIGWMLFIFTGLMDSSCQTEVVQKRPAPPVVNTSKPITSICTSKRTPNQGFVNVLFVGNSLTYFNDLPLLVEEVASQRGEKWETEMVALPNYALEDHWNDGKFQTMICENSYDYVVVQQGPSSQEDGKQMLLEYGALIKTLCESRDSKLAFFMVWPSRQYYHTFDGVISNYAGAAAATNSILCPVGQHWRSYFDTTGDYSYYGEDGFHPSRKGSEVAAEVIFESLRTK